MSNVKSNAKILSKSALWETVFGGTAEVRSFVFQAGKKQAGKPTYYGCVVGYGQNELEARAHAESVLCGKFGRDGYHLGDLIPTV